ncbi:hypothetical protein LCGC14_1932990 [marine sediment metagenome]|uniref:Uncharacterized protein n=1 Tax=marine sediment metagenome TaxID=412755 RepID=A0A0F9I192_9ZZZZ
MLGFDDTIYYNPRKNYTVNINFDDIFHANTFFGELAYQTQRQLSQLKSSKIILLTRRPSRQKQLILHLLKLKGYNISKSYFINFHDYENIIDEATFLINYWTQKAQLINQLKLSGKYSSITVIDNDSVICSMLSQLDHDIIQAKFFVLDIGLQILFTPLNSSVYNNLSIDLNSNIKIKGDV